MFLRRQMVFGLILVLLAACAAPTLQPTGTPTPTPTPSPPAVETPTPTSDLAPGIELVAILPVLNPEIYSFSWAPEGTKLAFFSGDGLQVAEAPLFEPRVVAEEFSGVTLLGGNTGPLWSPSGDRIAITAPTILPGEEEWQPLSIWLVNADGTGLRDLLPGEKAVLSVSTGKILIEWLDDRTLAFAEHMGTGVDGLFLLDVESGELTPVTLTADAVFGFICGTVYYFSPTDKETVVSECWGQGLPQITILNLSSVQCLEPFGKVEVCAWEGAWGEWEAFEDWSPDATVFLFTKWKAEGEKIEPVAQRPVDLYLWDLLQSEPQVVMPNATSAAWSPDGSLIAFYLVGQPIYDEEGKPIGTDFTAGQPMRELALFFMVYDLHTRHSVMGHIMVSDPGDFQDPFEVWNWLRAHKPVWSPDGKAVVFWDARGGVYLLDTPFSAGRARIPLASPEAGVTSAAWSPDGEFLALATGGDVETGEPGTLWIVRAP